MPAPIHKNKPAVGVDGCKSGWFVVDIVDAFVLAVTALSLPETIVTFPQNPPYDDQQLPMEIVYTNCKKNEY
jgi:predicted RNase H-like nuclease